MLVNIYIKIAGFFLYWLILLVNKTLRLTIIGADNYYSLKDAKKNIVFVFWHQASFIPLYHYRNRGACIMTMTSLRGQVLAQTAKMFGYRVVQMEQEADPAGLRKLFKMVLKGSDCNIAVDGPLGPLHKAKPGAFFLAQKLKKPILPVASAAKSKLVLKTRWDKYFIPLPFSRAVLILGQPIDPTAGSVEQITADCERKLYDLTRNAESFFSVSS